MSAGTSPSRAHRMMAGVTLGSWLVAGCNLVIDTSSLMGEPPATPALEEGGRDVDAPETSDVDTGAETDANTDAGMDADAGVDAECPPVGADSFERAVKPGLGFADVGGLWFNTGDELSEVADGRAKFGMAPGQGSDAILSEVSVMDADVAATFSLGQAFEGPTGSGLYVTLHVRRINPKNNYYAVVLVKPNGYFDIYVSRRIAGTETTLQRANNVGKLTLMPGTRYRLRTTISTADGGALLRARVWKVGDPEPTTWFVEATDTTPSLQERAPLGFGVYTSASSTTPKLDAYVDDFIASPVNGCPR